MSTSSRMASMPAATWLMRRLSGPRTAATMRAFRETGTMPVPDDAWQGATALFHGLAVSDEDTIAEMRRLHAQGYLADPHTAVGTAAARAHAPRDPGIPVVVAATAHPAKFPDAVERATGQRPPLPPPAPPTRTPAPAASVRSR